MNAIPEPAAHLQARLLKIRCLLLDVDGVLTDGKLHFDQQGNELKSFHIQDGHGLAMIRRAGLVVGLISGRHSEATTRRAEELGIGLVFQGARHKGRVLDEIQQREGLDDATTCYVGDDLVDLPVLQRVGVAVAVANAVDEVKAVAHYVTRRSGGEGAVREVTDLLLKAQGRWDELVQG